MAKEFTEEQKQQAYITALEKFNIKQGYTLTPAVQLKQSRDTGEYTLVAVNQIVKLPEKQDA